MTAQRSSDAPQNLVEFHRWRKDKNAWNCDDHYLEQVDPKWSRLGKLVAQPASLRNVTKI